MELTDGLRQILVYAIQKAEITILVSFNCLISAVVVNLDLAGNVVFLH
jgi:hypothetical protein